MEADECLLVDELDNIAGSVSKSAAHRRVGALGDRLQGRQWQRGRLLLQQRAGDKVTFPLVWTNTCCSHPLHGQTPSEVDSPEDVVAGRVPGIKHAARRKLEHELGLQLPLESLTFLTRLHYCAADESEPEAGMWGEHELDYVLVTQQDAASLHLAPNPQEIEAVRFVDRNELRAMMDPSSGLRWSPWFRILAKRLLPAWWDSLDEVVLGGRFVDGQIHRFSLADEATMSVAATAFQAAA